MDKYYCLLLNNCNDIGVHYASNGENVTMFPNIIDKNLSSLLDLENEFMKLDYMITEYDDHYRVYGRFPVIGKVIDGKMYDVITGEEFIQDEKYFKGLSYQKAVKADNKMVEIILTLLDEEAIKRYTAYLNNIESYSIGIHEENRYNIQINGVNTAISAKNINGVMVELTTGKSIFNVDGNSITSELSYTYLLPINYPNVIDDNNVEEYMQVIRNAQVKAICNYHNYININKAKVKFRAKTM